LAGSSRAPFERLIQGEQVVVARFPEAQGLVQADAAPPAAMLGPPLAPGLVDEDAAHGLGGGGEEVAPAVPVLDLVHVHQPEVRLVDQGGGLEGLARLLLGQLLRRQPAQLLVDQQQLVGGARVALLDGRQDARDLTHRRHRKSHRSRRNNLSERLELVPES
jgi:hypothetical protein